MVCRGSKMTSLFFSQRLRENMKNVPNIFKSMVILFKIDIGWILAFWIQRLKR